MEKNTNAASIPPLTAPAPHLRKATTELSLPELAEEFRAVAALGCDYTISAGVCAKLYEAMTTPPAAPAPQESEGLSDERIRGIHREHWTYDEGTHFMSFARAIEREVAKAAPAAPVQTELHPGRYWAIHEGDLLGLMSVDIGAAYVDPIAAAKRCRVTIHSLPNFVAAPAQAEQAQAEPVARLHEEISDRPYSEGKPYFEITILDRKRCFDGMNLYAAPALPAQAEQVAAVRAAEWISVEDRLPEKYCLAAYLTNRGKFRIIRAMYVKQYEIEATGDDCYSEYREEDDTEYLKPGWYELIDNWGEYSSCFVNEGEVKFWMPLPAAPSTATSNDTSALGDTGGAK
jgi:hypothetical protein